MICGHATVLCVVCCARCGSGTAWHIFVHPASRARLVGRHAPLGPQNSLKPRNTLYTLPTEPQPDQKHKNSRAIAGMFAPADSPACRVGAQARRDPLDVGKWGAVGSRGALLLLLLLLLIIIIIIVITITGQNLITGRGGARPRELRRR